MGERNGNNGNQKINVFFAATLIGLVLQTITLLMTIGKSFGELGERVARIEGVLGIENRTRSAK